MDIAQEVEAVEEELLTLIVAHLENNELDAEKAQQLAKDFLALLPISDQKDLLGKLKDLGETYKEAREVYVEELSKTSSQQRDTALITMRDAIKQGNIDHAITVAKNLQQASN